MAENTKKPAIRFAGFTEAWEQRKVGDFLTESRIRGNTGLDAKKLTVKLWGKGVIEKNDFGGSEHTQYFTRRKGQFIYSKLDFLNSAFGVIPEKLDNYESTADLPTFDLDGMNPYFMFFTAIQEDFYLKYGSIADGSRKAKRIHADTFLNMPIMVPTIDEQKLIVGYLQCLDNLITLHQREYGKFTNVKKSMLEKMFPKNGSNVPEIRFKGFTETWEQRKLGEFGKATSGTSIESEFTETGKYKVISIGSYSETSKYTDQGIRATKTEKTEKRILNKNDLTMILNDKTASGNIIGRVLLIDADDTYVYNQRTERIEVYENEYLPEFLYQLLNADNVRSKIIRASQGNTQIYVNWSSISELVYEIPVSKEEQTKIGEYFRNLDNLITLHQRKLEKLKNIKKSMLEKMFI